MAVRGKVFESEIKASLERAGCFAMRIPDKLYWTGRRIASEETPADPIAIAIANDRAYPILIECKATAQKSLSFSALQDHQYKSLVGFEGFHRDCHSFVVVNFYDGSNIRNRNLCYFIPIGVWAEYRSGKKKSISIKECDADDRIISCQRAKGSTYDVGKIFQFL